MKNVSENFRHESLQDSDTIADVLQSLQRGIQEGSLSFSDEDSRITLKPSGLLNLVIKASDDDGLNVLDVRISWQSNNTDKANRKLTISAGET